MGNKIAEPQPLVSCLLISESVVLFPKIRVKKSRVKSVWEMRHMVENGGGCTDRSWFLFCFPFIFFVFLLFSLFSPCFFPVGQLSSRWKAGMSKVVWKPFVLVLFFMCAGWVAGNGKGPGQVSLFSLWSGLWCDWLVGGGDVEVDCKGHFLTQLVYWMVQRTDSLIGRLVLSMLFILL